MPLTLRYYGDPVLRTAARSVRPPDPDLARLAADMIATMRASEGVGLAAQQIGETRAICVVEVPADYDQDAAGQRINPDLPPMPLVLLNPEIHTLSDKTDSREEGCLSFPDIRGKIDRALEIGVRYLDLDGHAHDVTVRGFAARGQGAWRRRNSRARLRYAAAATLCGSYRLIGFPWLGASPRRMLRGISVS